MDQPPELTTRIGRRILLASVAVAFIAALGVLLFGTVLFRGTGPTAEPSVASPSPLAGYVLPSIAPALEVDWVCAGVGLSPLFLEGQLEGGVAEVWAGTPTHRIPLRWPAGYRARFEPGLVIINRDGIVVAHGGDNMDTGVPPWPGLYVCPYGAGVPSQFVVDVYQMAATPAP